jgi:tRNA-dihydrouridine synthase A
MVGRSAYDNPYPLVNVDQAIYSQKNHVPTRAEILEGLVPYMENEIKNGNKLGYVTKHLMGLFKNTKHAKKARNTLANIDDGFYPMEKLKLLINETKELC